MTTITPGAVRGEAHAAGRFASTLLSVAMATRTEAGRFRRGKSYLLDDTVLQLEVDSGRLRGTVQGTMRTPYRVEVSVPVAPRPADLSPSNLRRHLNMLVPEPHVLRATCTCADGESPCKHAVAVVLAFAQELVVRPELLVEWRCGVTNPADRPRIGARADRSTPRATADTAPNSDDSTSSPSPTRPSTRPLHTDTSSARPRVTPAPRRPAPVSPWETEEWFDFLGDPTLVARAVVTVPDEQVRLGRSVIGSFDLTDVVRSAQAAIRGEMV